MQFHRSALACVIAASAALTGCASRSDKVAVAPPPPQVALGPMPRPPAGATIDLAIPQRSPDGSYATPNRALSSAATLWHVRAALNVAALGCRGSDENQLIASYNALLKAQKPALAKAQKAVTSEYGQQAAFDDAMTRLYNFFAQPPAQNGFCAAAAQILGESATVTPATLDAFAARAITQLDAPFVQFYRDYDSYRAQLASWQSARMVAARAPVTARPGVAVALSAPIALASQSPAPKLAPRLGYDRAVFRMP